jgi:hypothetical protein
VLLLLLLLLLRPACCGEAGQATAAAQPAAHMHAQVSTLTLSFAATVQFQTKYPMHAYTQ